MTTRPRARRAHHGRLTPPPTKCVVRLYDTKSAKASVVVVKVQGEDKTLDLTDENEEDICKHFKVQHGTKEFFKVVLERLSLIHI